MVAGSGKVSRNVMGEGRDNVKGNVKAEVKGKVS